MTEEMTAVALNQNADRFREWLELLKQPETPATKARAQELRVLLAGSIATLASLADAGGKPVVVDLTRAVNAIPLEAFPEALHAQYRAVARAVAARAPAAAPGGAAGVVGAASAAGAAAALAAPVSESRPS
jgi:hypothetical protein